MATDENISVSVHLEQVSVQSVEPKTTDREAMVILEVHDGLRISESNKALFQQIKSKDLNRNKILAAIWTVESPSLVVMGGVSCPKGHKFQSQHCILVGHFFI